MLETQFEPTIPLDRQLTDHLRRLIQAGKLPPDAKLPPIRAMAELWETNYHTVHDALSYLASEGFVVLRPVSGSFVAPPRRVLRRVCLYHNYSFHAFAEAQEFYSLLNVSLYTSLARRNITLVPYYDDRPYVQRHIRPPTLRKMAVTKEIDAVIAIEIFPVHTGWLSRLEVPAASLMMRQPDRRIEVDVLNLARKVVELAMQSGRKRIGLIHMPASAHIRGRKNDLLRTELERLAAHVGIAVVCPEKPVLAKNHTVHWEQISAWRCERLLQAAEPPDMIFVYPDDFMRGVATAIMKNRIDVPGQILVASHRNAENIIYVPFPMTWFTVKVEDFASALIEQIDWQIQGEKLFPKMIDVEIEQTTPAELEAPRS